VDTKRRLLFSCLALQAVGLLLGLLIPPGEATVHGILLLIATVVLLFPGSVFAVLLNAQILPQRVIQSQRVDSIVNVVTAVVLNCLLFGVVAAILRRRRFKG
jgi:hypothetical protein